MWMRLVHVFSETPVLFFGVVIGVAVVFRIGVGVAREAATPAGGGGAGVREHRAGAGVGEDGGQRCRERQLDRGAVEYEYEYEREYQWEAAFAASGWASASGAWAKGCAAGDCALTAGAAERTRRDVCRNIRVLHHFQPPTTADEINAAALQYVRKVSGLRAPGKSDVEAFERAVAEVAEATSKLLAALPSRGDARTREGERAKARIKWTARATRIAKSAS